MDPLQHAEAPSPFLDTLTASSISVWILRAAQESKYFPWIDAHREGINKGISAALAFASQIGLHWAFTGSMTEGGELRIHVPPMAEIVYLTWRTVGSYATNELMRRGIRGFQPAEVQEKQDRIDQRMSGDRSPKPLPEMP